MADRLQKDLFNLSPTSTAGAPREVDLMGHERKDGMVNLLQRAKNWWDEREDFRRRRARSRDYRRGEQWQEMTENEDGERVTEEKHIKQQGRIPWVINQVATVVRNLVGQFRQNQSDRAAFSVEKEDTEATEQMNEKRRGTRRWNRAETVERDEFEEFIISGASGFKITIDWIANLQRNEVEIDGLDQTRLFFNQDLDDRRMKNLRLVGELHDLTPEELLATYGRDANGDFDRDRVQRIKEIYSDIDNQHLDHLTGGGFDRTDSLSFYTPVDSALSRVIEVWTKQRKITRYAHDRARGTWTELDETTPNEAVEQANAEREAQGVDPIEVREKVEPTWVVHHLSPRGDVLFEQETPYWHGSHPYVIGLANLIDGETWGLIEQIIDPQRWLNRLVAMIDHGMGAGAKGVLMVPEQSIPDDMTLDDYADEWSKQGGVIKIKMKPGVEPPQEITTNSIKPGSFELLQQLKSWIEQTSGVHGAQLGEQPNSDTPALLYQQQIQQSGLTNLDYFESFFEAARQQDWKVVQCLQQAIDRPIQIAEGPTQDAITYNPEDVREIKFDVSMGSVKDTATFQQIFEEDLRTFLESGFIDFGTYLQMSAHPKADTLLRVLQQRDPDMLGMGTTEMQAATQALAEEGGLPEQGRTRPSGPPATGDGAAQGQPQLPQR